MGMLHQFHLNSASRVALLAAGLAALAPQSVQAQDADGLFEIEEIVVTARKRSETLQDVPFSINAQTEEMLRNKGATTLEDLANNVAGFTIQNLGPGQSQVSMRGISAGQIVRDQPGVKEQVGVYLDESVISLSLFTPDLDLFDMNRVEVLRGPQGTLFGSGSLSGTVRYISNKPNLEETEMVAEATGSLIDGGDFGADIKGVVNIPLAEGKAGVRAVAYYKSFAGFIDAVQPGGGINNDVNDGSRFGGRVTFTFQPTESLTITPRVIYQDIEIDGFNRFDIFNILANPFTTTRPPVTLGERQQFTQLQEGFDDEFLLLDATIEWDAGPVVFTSVTSYTDRDVLVTRDSTQLAGSVTGQPGVFTPGGLPESVFTLDAPLFDATSVEVFTQEARVASNDDGPFQWVLGVFYSDIERVYGQSLPVTGFEALANPILGTPAGFTAGVLADVDELFFSNIPYDFEQIAIFGEATLDVTDELSVTAGLRWFDFTETRTLNFDGIFAAQTIGLEGRTSSNGVSPRFIVSYEASDGVQLNAQAAKGFRLGGINDPLNLPVCSAEDAATFGGFDTFGDEELWNYEVGAKTRFMNGRATFNIAAFYADIDDLQATLEAGTCSSRIVFNVPKARSVGVEAELFVVPTDNFEFSVVASLTDSEFRSTVTSTDPAGNVTVLAAIEKGNRLPTVPKFQLAASATYTQQFAEMEGFITGTVQHVGSRFTQAGDADPAFGTINLIPIGNPSITTFTFDPKLPAYQIGNLRFGVRNDQWELALFVNNIWDEVARLGIDRERGNRARVGFLTNQPRTFGFTARANF
ncbi:MAG: TonB-dependent receptor [Sphingomonadales bacterium]